MTYPTYIAKHPVPVTRAAVARACTDAGLSPGGSVLAHCRMSAFGYVIGSEVAWRRASSTRLAPTARCWSRPSAPT